MLSCLSPCVETCSSIKSLKNLILQLIVLRYSDTCWSIVYHFISTGIGCAAHILLLCVDDILSDDSYNASKSYIDVIKAARVVVEAVRSHDDMAAVIQSCGLETPILDTSNR